MARVLFILMGACYVLVAQGQQIPNTTGKTDTEIFPSRAYENNEEKVSGEDTKPTKLETVAVATQMTQYKIGTKFGLIILPLTGMIGLVGNTLSGLVMFHKDNRHVSCYFYMGVLAITDSMYLLAATTYNIMQSIPRLVIPYYIHQRICSSFWPIMTGSALCGTYIILAMTLDRLIAVKWPLKSLTWCTLKRARISTISIVMFCFLVKLPYGWLTKPVPSCVSFQVERTNMVQAYYWINSTVSCYIPFTILFILNLLIIQTMRKRGKYFESMKSSETGSGPMTSETPSRSEDTKDAKKARAEKSMTRMLLFVTFSFLILNSPVYIFYIVYLFVSPMASSAAFAEYYLIANICAFMFTMNFSINFYLYCLAGSKFRKDLRKMCSNFCKH